jgi:hypothetical protein
MIDDSNSVSVLINRELKIYDINTSADLVEKIYSTPPYVSVQSTNGLYQLSKTDFKNIIEKTVFEDDKVISTVKNSASIAVYHTVKFGNLADLVLFWHENLGHLNMDKMISVVQNKLILGLPEQLTENAIRKFFPNPCLKCSIGNLQASPHPPPKTFNPNVPIGGWWSVDFKKYSGADNNLQVKALKGFTHFFLAIDYQSGRGFGYPVKSLRHVEKHLENLYNFNLRKGYTMYGLSIDAQFVTAATSEFLKDPENNLQYTLLSREISDAELNEKYTFSSDTLIIKKIAIPYEHFTTGDCERLNRTMHESVMKISL